MYLGLDVKEKLFFALSATFKNLFERLRDSEWGCNVRGRFECNFEGLLIYLFFSKSILKDLAWEALEQVSGAASLRSLTS